jgi:hypothetical protein
MEVRANFPLSVSGFALDTSPLKGWRKGMNSPRSAPFLTPFRGRGVEPEGRDGEGDQRLEVLAKCDCPALVGRV